MRPAPKFWTSCWTCGTAWRAAPTRLVESAAALGRGWLAARLTAACPRNRGRVAEGYDLTAARLDELLAGFNVREIECVGRAFDPARMQVVATEEAAGAAEGTVLEVYRRGYEIEWRGVPRGAGEGGAAKRKEA